MLSLSVMGRASAQSIVYATTPDEPNVFPTAVPAKTGCDVTHDVRGQLRVFVWASSVTASTIGWEWTDAAGIVTKNTQVVAGPTPATPGTITDPDVVVAHPYTTSEPFNVLVTYLQPPAAATPTYTTKCGNSTRRRLPSSRPSRSLPAPTPIA